jgi:hypothetical protein
MPVNEFSFSVFSFCGERDEERDDRGISSVSFFFPSPAGASMSFIFTVLFSCLLQPKF